MGKLLDHSHSLERIVKEMTDLFTGKAVLVTSFLTPPSSGIWGILEALVLDFSG